MIAPFFLLESAGKTATLHRSTLTDPPLRIGVACGVRGPLLDGVWDMASIQAAFQRYEARGFVVVRCDKCPLTEETPS